MSWWNFKHTSTKAPDSPAEPADLPAMSEGLPTPAPAPTGKVGGKVGQSVGQAPLPASEVVPHPSKLSPEKAERAAGQLGRLTVAIDELEDLPAEEIDDAYDALLQGYKREAMQLRMQLGMRVD